MQSFRIDISQADLDDLNRRLELARWPTELPGAGWERGVPLGYLKELVDYWRTSYNWRSAEDRLNRIPQFISQIDGVDVHFLHVRSPERTARPMILTHGWPSSVAEFLDVIGPLTDPRSHGADPADAFHLVIPSVPGYGFSGPVSEAGWNIARVARAWGELMRRLGYGRYIAQGGDLGAFVSLVLATVDPAHAVGVHVNFLPTPPPQEIVELQDLAPADTARLQRAARFIQDESAYMRLQASRPQTLAYALTDSPVGQLAWIIEKFKEWTDSDKSPEDAVDRDRLLTNATIYWLTATGGSSAQLYFEAAEFLPTAPTPASLPPLPVPIGVAVFPKDIMLPIRQFADHAFPNIVHWSEFDHGGHFAAMEQPDLFLQDLRTFAREILA